MRDGYSRRTGRLFFWLLAYVIGVGVALGADPATTKVSDTIFRADGTFASGVVLISWPAFTTADNKPVAAGTKSVDIGAKGSFTVDLVPNVGSIPAGTLYRVIYKTDGETTTEYWSVGTSSPTTIAAIRTTLGSGTASQIVSRQYVDSVTAAKANDTAVVHNSGSEFITGSKQFEAPPSVPAPLQANDAANKAYVDEAVAASGSGSYVSKAGDSMSGPLSLSSDPMSPAHATTKHYVDSAITGKADLLGGLVPTGQLGSGTAGAANCLKGDQSWGPCGSGSNATSLQGVPIDTAIPTDGQVQTYDAASGKYKPKTGGGSSANATQLQGVNIDAIAPSKGQLQVFDDITNRYKPQSKAWIDPRDYGAKCDNSTDDAAAFQSMFNANPGGHFLLPGSTGTPGICFFSTALTLKGAGWVLEGGGASYAGGGRGGSTMRWAAGSSGLITLNAQGPGTIRHLNLQGGENFVGAENGTWPDAILPNFTDQGGINVFNRSIGSIARTSNVVTVKTQGLANEIGCHTYSPGTQIAIAGVADTSYNGLYYVTGISSTQGAGCFDTFTYANTGGNGTSSGGTAGIANTGTSTSDGIVAGTNYLRIEDVNLQSWGRFGINCTADSAAYWCDNDSFQRVTITNGRGVGLYVRGGDANAGDFQQINTQVVLAGGILDLGFLGNTWVAPNVTNAGSDVLSINGSTVAVSGVTCSANLCTATTATSHGLIKGQAAVLAGLADGSFQAPPGSAVFIASVPTSTTFTYNFTRANGSTTGGTIRLANATELFTAAGIGQNQAGTAGTGFSYWISGLNNNRTVNNPYCEGTSGPLKLGAATMVWGGTLGCPPAAGFGSYPAVQSAGTGGQTNVVVFDRNISGATPDRGTDLLIRGGHSSSQSSSLRFVDYNLSTLRWLFNDTTSSGLQGFHIYRGNFINPRLDLYDPNGVNSVAGWSFLNGEGANGNVVLQPAGSGGLLLGWNSGSNWSGLKIFDGGTGTAVATIDKAGKGTFNGGLSTTKLSGITDTTMVGNLNAEMVGGKHVNELGGTGTADWNTMLNKPSTFPPATHTHAEADVSNLVADLGLKANVVSPAFTGAPTAPTPVASDNSTAIATTAFVRAQTGIGEQPTYSGDKTINGNLTITGQVTVSGPYQVESSAPTSAMTAAAANNSKFGFDTDGKLKVSENAGAITELAKKGAIDASDIVSGTIAAARIANVPTATALATTPTACGAGVAATGVDASGNAVGCFSPGGGSISVNGVAVASPNFNNSNPSPGTVNVIFDYSGSSVAAGVQSANVNSAGVVTANTQTFGGDKTFNAKVTTAVPVAAKAGLNLPSGTSPTTPTAGDIWNLSGVLKFFDGATTKSVASTDLIPGDGSCTNQVLTGITNGAGPTCASITSSHIVSGNKQGNGTKFSMATGTFTSGNYRSSDVNGNAVDSGVKAGPYAAALVPWTNQSVSSSASALTVTASPSTAKVYGFVVTHPLTTTQIAYIVGTADNTANIYDLGIYNGSGSLVLNLGGIAGTAFSPTTGWKTASWTQGATTLQPGMYYVAYSSNCTTSCAALTALSSGGGATFYWNGGQAAMASGGVLLSGPMTFTNNYSAAASPLLMWIK